MELARARGRVGAWPADLHVRHIGNTIRVDCSNHMDFWLEIDAKTLSARGRLSRSMVTAGEGRFVVRLQYAGIRVDHTANPSFWLELSMYKYA